MVEYRQLGKYKILEEIGKGGFATVYRARDPDLDRVVALKVLDPLLTRDSVWVARFRREARAVGNLDHSHVVTIYEIGQAEGLLYIAMRLVEGGNLAEHIAAQGRLPWDQVVRLVGEIAAALDFAHDQGVIHRDLKAANVLLDEERGAQLTDFGFVRMVAESSFSVSVSGGIVGTPQYIAPEIWEDRPASPQTDIYALGCILYEMVMGEHLFEGDTTPAVMRAHFQPLDLSESWPEGVPSGLREVLETALAKEPEARYARAGELAQAVAALTTDHLAEPYAALEAAVAAREWAEASRLAGQIRSLDPDYRDVAVLEGASLAGLEQIARARKAASWRAGAEQALKEGDRRGAERAMRKWQALTPDDPDLERFLQRLEAGSDLPDERPQRRLAVWIWGAVGAAVLLALVAVLLATLQSCENGLGGVAFWAKTPTRVALATSTHAPTATPTAVDTATDARVTASVETAPVATSVPPTDTPSVPPLTATDPPAHTPTVTRSPTTTPTSTIMPTSTATPTPTLLPIVFTVKLAGQEDYDLYLMDEDGRQQSKLAATPGQHEAYARWSPDGRFLAFSRAMPEGDIVLLATEELYSLDPLAADGYFEPLPGTQRGWQVAWSPSGKDLVFEVPQKPGEAVYDVWRLNTATGNKVQLTDHTMSDRDPAWSPDGSHIAFSTNRAGGIWEIYLMAEDGSNQLPLTVRTEDRSPAWSPDGRRIAFVSSRDGNFEIYVMNADGSAQTRLTYDPANDIDPGWTPDGRILFVSDRDGDAEIFVVSAGGTGLLQLTNNQDEDRWPDWRR